MRVKGPIKRGAYRKLIEYTYGRCDVVMFVTKQRLFDKDFKNDRDGKVSMGKTIRKIEKIFESDFIKKRTNSQWVGGGFVNEKTRNFFTNGFGVYFYKFSESLKNFLLSNTNLYSWHNPDYPEDIAFFKDGYCWLSSSTNAAFSMREEIDIYCENEQEYKRLKEIGIEFIDDFFISTPKSERYYEGYNKNDSHKNVLGMSEAEYSNNLWLLTEKEKIERLVSPRLNRHYPCDSNILLKDAIVLKPYREYLFTITCDLKTFQTKVGVALKLPYGDESIGAVLKDRKKIIIWLSDKKRQREVTITSGYGTVIIYPVFERRVGYLDGTYSCDKHEYMRKMGLQKDAERYLLEHLKSRSVIETPDTALDMGMKPIRVSENEIIYHCRWEWHHGEDDFVFRVKWDLMDGR